MPVTQYSPGAQLIDPSLFAGGGGFTQQNAITAHAGGGQANGVPLTAAICNVTVVGTIGDSVCLPSAVGGQEISLFNSATNSMNVFSSNASTADTINGTAGTTAFALAGGKNAEFVSPAQGVWRVILSS